MAVEGGSAHSPAPLTAFSAPRFTCPFVEKFSIDIETFYKSDSGENPNVFNLSPAEKNQLTIGKWSRPRGCDSRDPPYRPPAFL